MAEEAEGGDEAMTLLRGIAADVAHLRAQLDRAMPVIDAYLSPTASGPVAWAVRRQQRKGGTDAG